jgi:hypothetical protein
MLSLSKPGQYYQVEASLLHLAYTQLLPRCFYAKDWDKESERD